MLSLCHSEWGTYEYSPFLHSTAPSYSRRLIKENPRSPDGKGPADAILRHTMVWIWIQHHFILALMSIAHPPRRVRSTPPSSLPPPTQIHPTTGDFHSPPTGHPRLTGGGPTTTSSPRHRPDHTSPRRHKNLTVLANRRSPAFQPSRSPTRP